MGASWLWSVISLCSQDPPKQAGQSAVSTPAENHEGKSHWFGVAVAGCWKVLVQRDLRVHYAE
jgi:hypothetical protein